MKFAPGHRRKARARPADRWKRRAFAALAVIYAAMVVYACKTIERRSEAYQAALAPYDSPSVYGRPLELPNGFPDTQPGKPFHGTPPESMLAQAQSEVPNRLKTLVGLVSAHQTVRRRLGLDGPLRYTPEDVQLLQGAGLLRTDEAELLEQLHQALARR